LNFILACFSIDLWIVLSNTILNFILFFSLILFLLMFHFSNSFINIFSIVFFCKIFKFSWKVTTCDWPKPILVNYWILTQLSTRSSIQLLRTYQPIFLLVIG
jgi:hypothetical protein